MRAFRASLKTLNGSLRKVGLAAYTRIPLINPLVNGFLEEPKVLKMVRKKIAIGENISCT